MVYKQNMKHSKVPFAKSNSLILKTWFIYEYRLQIGWLKSEKNISIDVFKGLKVIVAPFKLNNMIVQVLHVEKNLLNPFRAPEWDHLGFWLGFSAQSLIF